MPVLKVRDPNTGAYVPLLTGGPDEVVISAIQPSSQTELWVDTAAPGGTAESYVLKSGDAMTGPLDVQETRIGVVWDGTYQGIQRDPVTDDGTGGAALLLSAGNVYLIAGGASGQIALRPGPGNVGTNDLNVDVNGLRLRKDPVAPLYAATKQYVDTYTDTASVTFTSPWRDYTNRTHRLTKYAGMVTLEAAFSVNSNLAIAANTIIQVATFPVGYRLPNEMSFPGVLYTGPSGNPVRGWYPVGFYMPSGNGLIQFSMGTAVTIGTDGALYGNPTFRQGG